MIKHCLVAVITITAAISCSKPVTGLSESSSYTNPILPIGPDPWVIQKDNFYYYTNTSGNRIDLWKTKSMSRLGSAEHKTVWLPSSGGNAYNLWAPELHYLDGKWYLYYAADASDNIPDQRVFVLENTSQDPLEGTWLEKGKIYDPSNDFFSIDATILEMEDKRYLVWSSASYNPYNQSIFIAQMANPWTLTGKRVLLSSPEYEWEKEGSTSDGGILEGPEILKGPAGKVFLIYSASACWTDSYCMGMLTLKNDADPLVPANWTKSPLPVFKTQSISKCYGPGHNSFFKSPDGKQDWIIYHAHTDPGQSCDDFRNPRIQKFTWNTDGTPDFGQPIPITLRFLRPSGEKD